MGKTKNWLLFGLSLAVIVMAFILFRGCKSSPVVDKHKNVLDSVVAANTAANKDLAWRIDSLTFVARDKDTLLRDLNDKARAWQGVAIEQTKTAKTYISLYKKAKADLDTSAMVANCDEVVNSYEKLYDFFANYTEMSDSVYAVAKETISIRDSIISNLKVKDSINMKTIVDLRVNYGNLIIDYSKLERKKSKAKWLDRGIGLGAGVIITSIFKK